MVNIIPNSWRPSTYEEDRDKFVKCFMDSYNRHGADAKLIIDDVDSLIDMRRRDIAEIVEATLSDFKQLKCNMNGNTHPKQLAT